MGWLAERFGLERLKGAEVVLPTDDFFPGAYEGTLDDARRMMEHLCGPMRIDPARVDLRLIPDDRMAGVGGYYRRSERRGQPLIRIAESLLTNPQVLAAALAHELAHELLHGSGLLDATVADHEWVTDLLPVYLGIGLFAANSTLHEEYHTEGQLSWWVIGKRGYLPARVFGYAMALFAFMRGEQAPSWAKYLRRDAATALRGGLRYLHKTGDSLFHPDTTPVKRTQSTATETAARLRSGTPSARLAALWEIQEHRWNTPECLAAVLESLDDRDEALSGEAARTLARFGAEAASAVPRLRAALWAASTDTRAAAASALGTLGPPAHASVPELCMLLDYRHRSVFCAAAEALSRLGVSLETRAIARLLEGLEAALRECDYPLIDVAAQALLAATVDPERFIRQHFAGRDRSLEQLALDSLAEQRAKEASSEQPGDQTAGESA